MKTKYIAIVITPGNAVTHQAYGPFKTRDKAWGHIVRSPSGRGYTTTLRSAE